MPVSVVIQGCLRVGAEIGEDRHARRGVDALNALQHPALVHPPILGGVECIPNRLFTRSAHNPPGVHAPCLGLVAVTFGHPKLTPWDSDLRGPPPGMDGAFGLPNTIPGRVVSIGSQDEIRHEPTWRGDKPHCVDSIVVRAYPKPKFIRIFNQVALAELLKDGIRGVVFHGCSHVEVLVIVGNPKRGLVIGGSVGEGGILGEMCCPGVTLPNVVVQEPVKGGRRWHAMGSGHLASQIERRLGPKTPPSPRGQGGQDHEVLNQAFDSNAHRKIRC